MCRIAGIIDFTNPGNLQKLELIRDSMTHGGPDDSGVYFDPAWPVAMGVRRLALIDLSSAGHQPMATADDQLWIAFNGEIYNFQSIRSELICLGHQFHSRTDTEVLLHAWQQWGSECFNRLNGMFALCILDRKRQQLILARDHAGMKPLYYFFDPVKRQLYFASEVRAFKHIRPDWPEDEAWRVHMLSYGHLPEPSTTLLGVKSLPKGSYMTVDIPSFNSMTQSWYQLAEGYRLFDAADARTALQKTLDQAVQQHLVADAPIGLFLSGGVDSSILTLLASKIIPNRLHTLSIIFDEAAFSEKKYQDLVIGKTGSRHQSFTVTSKEFESSMPDIMEAMDQPSTDGINSYFISKYAKASGLKAVLSGIGADELFGGYESFKRRQTVQKLRRLPGWMLGLAANVSDNRLKRISYLRYPGTQGEYLFYRGFYTPGQIAHLLDMDEKQVHQILFEQPSKPGNNTHSPGEYISRMEQDYYLQNQLLRDTDSMSMWHSVEIRMPFLDRNLLDLCAQTHPSIRFAPGMPKQWLINSFKEALPEEVWNRKKMGFIFPFNAWFKKATAAGACNSHFFEVQKQFKLGEIGWSRFWAYLLCMEQRISFVPAEQKLLFLTLTTFSATGGIEKFNRSFSKALHQNALEKGWQVTVFAAYDDAAEAAYYPGIGFTGFKGNRVAFAWAVIKNAGNYDTVIAGHINLSLVLVLSSFKKAGARFVLIAHGIEVWQPLAFLQRKALDLCNSILSVSHFTANVLATHQYIEAGKINIFPNTLDPFFATRPGNQAYPN